MKNKTKFFTIIGLLAVCAAFISCFLGWYYREWFVSEDVQASMWADELRENQADIMIYGNIRDTRQVRVDYRRIDSITETTLGNPALQVYHLIVIVDLDGSMKLSNEELLLIKKYCEEYFYDLYYFGNAHLDQFRDCGFFAEYSASDMESFMYQGYYYRNEPSETEEEVIYYNKYLLLTAWSSEDTAENDRHDFHLWQEILSDAVASMNDMY